MSDRGPSPVPPGQPQGNPERHIDRADDVEAYDLADTDDQLDPASPDRSLTADDVELLPPGPPRSTRRKPTRPPGPSASVSPPDQTQPPLDIPALVDPDPFELAESPDDPGRDSQAAPPQPGSAHSASATTAATAATAASDAGTIFGDRNVYCLECGFNLRGAYEPRCPECGRAFDPDRPATYYAPGLLTDEQARSRRLQRWTYGIMIAATALFGLIGVAVFDASGYIPLTLICVGFAQIVIAYFALWLFEQDRITGLGGYLVFGAIFAAAFGLPASILSSLVSGSWGLSYVVVGLFTGAFAGLVRRYTTSEM